MTAIFNAVLFGYVLLLLAIGVYYYFSGESVELSDFLLGGRDVSIGPMAISDAASAQSGFVFLAWVGVGYTTGFIGLIYGIGVVSSYLFIYRFMGSRLRNYSENLGSQTIVDHLSLSNQGTKWGMRIRILGFIIVGIFMTIYVGTQVQAVGQLIETTTGINYVIGITIASALVAVYVLLGGFNASIYSDFIQGLLAVTAVVVLPIVMISQIGGIGAFLSQAEAIDPSLLSVTRDNLWIFLPLALTYYGRALGLLGQPHALMRLQSIQSERLISRASIVTTTFLALTYIAPLIIGVAGRILYPNIGNPENTALVALQDVFPPLIAGIFAASILSIILSTTDSMLIVVSADLTRLYETITNTSVDESTLIFISRIGIIAVAILGFGVAYLQPTTLFVLIGFAYIGMGVSFGVPLLTKLLWEKTTGEAIFVTMLVGMLSTIVSQLYFPILAEFLPWPITIGTMIISSYISSP